MNNETLNKKVSELTVAELLNIIKNIKEPSLNKKYTKKEMGEDWGIKRFRQNEKLIKVIDSLYEEDKHIKLTALEIFTEVNEKYKTTKHLLGVQLNKMGFKSKHVRINGGVYMCYNLKRKQNL